MKITEKQIEGVQLISVSGRLDADEADEMEKRLDVKINEGPVYIVIDFGRLEYISSSGLRVLLSALKKVTKEQGDIRLTGLIPHVRDVFDITGLIQLFKIFEKREDAVRSFKEERE